MLQWFGGASSRGNRKQVLRVSNATLRLGCTCTWQQNSLQIAKKSNSTSGSLDCTDCLSDLLACQCQWCLSLFMVWFQLDENWQIDYESYSWKKIDPTTPESKKMINEHFLWEGDFDGKKFNQGKIYKWCVIVQVMIFSLGSFVLDYCLQSEQWRLKENETFVWVKLKGGRWTQGLCKKQGATNLS